MILRKLIVNKSGEKMKPKKLVKRASISIFCLVLVVFAFKNYTPIYFPHQEKMIKLKIDQDNHEAAIFIGVDLAQKDELKVRLYDNSGNICEVSKILSSKDSYKYNYLLLKPGEVYTIKVNNITDSFVFSEVLITHNN